MQEVVKKLAEENIGLVPFTINKYYRNKTGFIKNFDDLCSLGYIGLLKGCISWNKREENTIQLSTYLSNQIRNEVNRYFYLQEMDKRKANNNTLELNRPLRVDGSITPEELIDFIPSKANVIEETYKKIMFESVIDKFKYLEYREQQSIIMYYMYDMTLEEIGKKLGVSRTTISHYIKKAIRKIRFHLGGKDGIFDY